MKEKYLWLMLAAMENLVRNHSFAVPSPPRTENPQTRARSNLDTQSWGDPGYRHTEQATHPQLQWQIPTKRVPERERGILSAPVVTMRDS